MASTSKNEVKPLEMVTTNKLVISGAVHRVVVNKDNIVDGCQACSLNAWCESNNYSNSPCSIFTDELGGCHFQLEEH
jgi:hypothetical protein